MIETACDLIRDKRWEKEKMLVTSIFSFSHNIFWGKKFCLRVFIAMYRNGGDVRNGENDGDQHFLLFVQCFIIKNFSVFASLSQCYSRVRAYKTFFMLNSPEHEISKLDESNFINLLGQLLTCGDFQFFH